jgi:hypothetical protein
MASYNYLMQYRAEQLINKTKQTVTDGHETIQQLKEQPQTNTIPTA